MSTKMIPVAVLGLGGVGRELVRQVVATRGHHERLGVRFALSYLGDSSGGLCAGSGAGEELDDSALLSALAHKEAARPLAELPSSSPLAAVEVLRSSLPEGTLVVDCSATTETTETLVENLEEMGGFVVAANKKPFADRGQETFDRLTASNRCRWEATVGAGLPVISSLSRVIGSGDLVTKIQGAFSGSLGFIMTGLQEGRAFSDVVCEAKDLGYTEPDPRDDLSGMDVARKALILHRVCGGAAVLEDVEVQGLYPAEMAHLAPDDFMDALPSLDEPMAERIAACAAAGKVLRFGASLEGGTCVVGPLEVDATSPLGTLQGTNNLVCVETSFYRGSQALVVSGPGAGYEQTANGVLADMWDLASRG